MNYYFIKKKYIRKSFSKNKSNFNIPFLLSSQIQSYNNFIQNYKIINNRMEYGLHSIFLSFFPILSKNNITVLKFKSYKLKKPFFNVQECKKWGLTYAFKLKVLLRLITYSENSLGKKVFKNIKEEEVYLGELPAMTNTGSFITNGTERVIVSQLYRSPGVFFEKSKIKTNSNNNKSLVIAKIIPYNGSWLEFEFNYKGILFFRINRGNKILVTILLKAIGFTSEEILNLFFSFDIFTYSKNGYNMNVILKHLYGKKFNFDILDLYNNILIPKETKIDKINLKKIKNSKIKNIFVESNFLLNRILAIDILDDKGKILFLANTKIDKNILSLLIKKNINIIKTIYYNDLNKDLYISKTLNLDKTTDIFTSREHIYKTIYPNEPIIKDVVNLTFKNLFFKKNFYDFSSIGRMKFNKRIGNINNFGPLILLNEDIISVIKILIDLKNGFGEIDDIDHLSNRRIRCVGELLRNQIKFGLSKFKKILIELLDKSENEDLMPHDFIDHKPLTKVIREFFGLSELSQFMDQTNPLSEITHKRRISALGPGGLIRERAGFEVRDVHSTHYGRLCPIETPEGHNIGLINSLALYAKLNNYGFLETPYRKILNGKVTNKIDYLTAAEEWKYVIAQANVLINNKGMLTEELILARNMGNTITTTFDKVQYMDVSSNQIVSVAASLIPFIEHNDANRALMGANMLRQSVPCLKPEKSLIGTGIERIISIDSKTIIQALRGGIVSFVDSNQIVITVNKNEIKFIDTDVDIYNLIKYTRSNQNTNIHQRPIVNIGDIISKDDIIADGSATDFGELALGQNMLIAFMPWNGYNFEDSILVSEKVVADDRYTSIHIEEFSTMVLDTKLGPERITRSVPNLSSNQFFKLDQYGFIRLGIKVKAGDILIGKVTPKEKKQFLPEEKLIFAIFGKKIANVRDTSLKVPIGIHGTVIDIQILTKENVVKDMRCKQIIFDDFRKYILNLNIQFKILENYLFEKILKILDGQIVFADSFFFKKGIKLTKKKLLNIYRNQVFNIKVENFKIQVILQNIKNFLKIKKKKIIKYYIQRKKKITKGFDLPKDVLKIIKVYIAIKRRLQVGDKMSGRHGNKGVISCILPIEDMPYMADGKIIDIILNPLGVPSRMNVGQVLEVHLGLAAKGLGDRIKEIIKISSEKDTFKLRKFLNKIYNYSGKKKNFDNFSNICILNLAKNIIKGVPFDTPIFDGANESEINYMLNLAYPDHISNKLGMNNSKTQVTLYNGQTGEPFERFITVGYMYYLKLNHLVEEKIHARSIGPYSLVTQQPLGGKSQFGGQRFGEMEVWALEAYGASYILQEMLTIKSDDIEGRTKIYKNLIKGKYIINTNIPESFNVLIKEIRSLGIDIDLDYN